MRRSTCQSPPHEAGGGHPPALSMAEGPIPQGRERAPQEPSARCLAAPLGAHPTLTQGLFWEHLTLFSRRYLPGWLGRARSGGHPSGFAWGPPPPAELAGLSPRRRSPGEGGRGRRGACQRDTHLTAWFLSRSWRRP